ncbi:MAG: alpha/beta hydrolase [Bacteroidales bacterium]|nr:alpha/beta hydrolase [Bacteroidales bacterium]MDD4209460.1 alpha/beta hydrolase [Bacteroidales bacterium]
MVYIRSIILTLCLLLCLHVSNAQIEKLCGVWMDTLKVNNYIMLRLAFSIEKQNDTIIMFADSPDQYVKDIPITNYTFSDDTLALTIRSLGASFKGVYDQDKDLITGTFKQSGMKFSIQLKRIPKRIVWQRPQTPKEPFPYTTEDVDFLSADKSTLLSGTLSLPQGKGPFPLVIMISGSGWQDRNESIFGHKPFLVIADYLARNGIASFRYDDRKMDKYLVSTTMDLSKDTEGAWKYFSKDQRFNKIGLMGHSEGGIIALMLASRNKKVDFLISLAGLVQEAPDVLLYQTNVWCNTMKFSEEENQVCQTMNRDIFTLIQTEKKSDKLSIKLDELYTSFSENYTSEFLARIGFSPNEFMAKKMQLTNPWYLYFIRMKPKEYAVKVKCPVLALNGNKDMQVPFENIRLLEKYLIPNPSSEFFVMDGLNHLFQVANSGLVDEYGKIEETISEEVLHKMVLFIKKL